jgi:hypothetical protein
MDDQPKNAKTIQEGDRIVSSIMSKWRNDPEAKDLPMTVLIMLATSYSAHMLKKGSLEPAVIKTIVMGSVEVGCEMGGLPESAQPYTVVVRSS